MFQFGDALAIVCADTEANARAAADKVKVTLEELPAYMSAPAAMADDAIEIHPGTPNVYYEQKRAKRTGHQATHGFGCIRGGRRVLSSAPAAFDHGAGRRTGLFRR